MLGSSNSGHIDWFVVALESNVKDHDSTIIETDSKESWLKGMEIQAHDTSIGGEVVLGPGGILDGVAADETSRLLMEGVVTISDSEEVTIFWIPLDGSYISFFWIFPY
jgi:hypothetical protein